jgi:hypothetical protein
MVQERCGIHNLSHYLHHVLGEHVRRQLPRLKAALHRRLLQLQRQHSIYVLSSSLDSNDDGLSSMSSSTMLHHNGDGERFYDPSDDHSSSHRHHSHCRHDGAQLLRLVTMFVQRLQDSIILGDSKPHHFYGPAANNPLLSPSDPELSSAGAQICRVLHADLGRELRAVQTEHPLSVSQVRAVLRSGAGPLPPLFVPERCFDALCRQQIQFFLEPAMQCVHRVADLLSQLIHRAVTKLDFVRRYPRLQARLGHECQRLLEDCREPTLALARTLLDMELAYVNTQLPAFWATLPSLAQLARQFDGQSDTPITREKNKPSMASKNNSSRGPIGQRSQDLNSQRGPTGQEGSSSPPGGLLSFFFLKKSHAYHRPLPSPQSPSSQKPATVNEREHEHEEVEEGDSPTKEGDDFDVQLVITLTTAYVRVVRDKLADSLPKAVMLRLVQRFVGDLTMRLVTRLYDSSSHDGDDQGEVPGGDLLEEDLAWARQRHCLEQQLRSCRRALTILNNASFLPAANAKRTNQHRLS